MDEMIEKKLARIEYRISKSEAHYSQILHKMERQRKREQDIHLTGRDSLALAESFAIGGIVEKLVAKLFSHVG